MNLSMYSYYNLIAINTTCMYSTGSFKETADQCAFAFYQEKDLKQYMDDCGGIMSMNNVRVSNPFWHFKPSAIHI